MTPRTPTIPALRRWIGPGVAKLRALAIGFSTEYRP